MVFIESGNDISMIGSTATNDSGTGHRETDGRTVDRLI